MPGQLTSAPRSYALRQEVLATLGKRALSGEGTAELLEDAAKLVAEALEVPYVGVFELLPESGAFLLRAGTGWKEGLVGRLTMVAEPGSQAGYTLGYRHPVSVEDGPGDSGLRSTPLFDSHKIVAGITVVIEGLERPFGVLGAHSCTRRRFAPDEVQFLHATAIILSQAIERERTARRMGGDSVELRSFLDKIPDLVSVIDSGGVVIYQNRAIRKLAGFKASQVVGKNAFEFIHPDDLPKVLKTIRESFNQPKGVHTVRYRIARRSGEWVALKGEGRWIVDGQGQPRLVVVSRGNGRAE